jgi:6-phosphogluconolactonase
MTTKVVPGVLIATPDAAQAAVEAAGRMARFTRQAIADRGSAHVALSGGTTPRAAYERFAGDATVDWSKVNVYFVDERAAAPTSERSNYRMVKEALLDRAKIPPAQVHRMPADAKDLAAAAKEYENTVRSKSRARAGQTPVMDLVVLGVGDDGHTASLFPGDKAVHEAARLVVDVPAKGEREARLTMTAPLLEAAQAIVVMAVGRAKHAPLERIWEVSGSLDDTPARVIRGGRGSITWVIDRAAGGMD